MRSAFVETVTRIMQQNDKVVLLLGDIGVFAFKKTSDAFPGRVINVGVCEQAMVSMAAGLALHGYYPICHTIEPFMCERALEQIKVFSLNGLRGAFVTCGASYDYGSLGPTHHCPAGPALMMTVPNMEVWCPGHFNELDMILSRVNQNCGPMYVRMCEGPYVTWPTKQDYVANYKLSDHALIVTTGTAETVLPGTPLCVGTARILKLDQDTVTKALADWHDAPILVIEPFYTGTMSNLIQTALYPRAIRTRYMGVPRTFISEYGTKAELDASIGMTIENVETQLGLLMDA